MICEISQLNNYLLLVILLLDLLKLFEWTLCVSEHNMKRNVSRRMQKEIFLNQSSLKLLCDRNYTETVWVCSLPSQIEDFGNTKKHKRVLVFRFRGAAVKIFLNTYNISVPNVNIFFKNEFQDIPLYHEDVSKNLYVFYEGNLVLREQSFPFSAEWNSINFKGRTFVINADFEFICVDISNSNFYNIDHCFYCSASCSDTELVDGSHLPTDNQDLFDYVNKFPELAYSSLLFEAKTKLFTQNTFPSQPLSCVLHIVADHLFYKYIGGGNVIKSVNVMFRIINDVDAIFRSTDFNGDKQGDNIGFLVGKITVFSDANNPNYTLSNSYMTSDDYIQHFAFYNFSDFCLGVGFTFRDFEGNAGASYQAHSDDSVPGGICQKQLKFTHEFINLNTAIVTFLNFGKLLKAKQVVLLLAHELGHSFGARHDMTTECHPNGQLGNFLMGSTITFQKLPNNPRFSVCSIRSILPVIKKKGSCLLYNDKISQCGNTIPEFGEECDCGSSSICDFIDPCCTPSDAEGTSSRPCTFRRDEGKVCSPVVNPCCTSSCTLIPLEDHHVCSPLEGCLQHSHCDGMSPHCPLNSPFPDGTLCNKGFQVCNKGVCLQQTCEYYNLTSCICLERTSQCKLCCKKPGTISCQPAKNYGLLRFGKEILYQPGERCSDNKFCDLTLRCMRKIPKVLGFKTSGEFEIFVKNYWLYYLISTVCILFTLTVMLLPYELNDNRHMKALRYGKLLALFSTGEHQTKIYRKILTDIEDYYTGKILKLQRSCDPKDYIEALGRLKLFFPDVHVSYLSRVAKLSASEPTAIKILILHGFKFHTFTSKLSFQPTMSAQSSCH